MESKTEDGLVELTTVLVNNDVEALLAAVGAERPGISRPPRRSILLKSDAAVVETGTDDTAESTIDLNCGADSKGWKSPLGLKNCQNRMTDAVVTS